MTRLFLIWTAFLTLTIGCSTDKDTKIYILFDSVNFLMEGDKVQTRGLEIGRVTNISLFDNDKILVEATIDRQQNIPRQSIFTLASADLLGAKIINVDYSDSKDYYSTKDTVQGITEKSLQTILGTELDSIKTVLMSDSGARVYVEAMNKAFGFVTTKPDSTATVLQIDFKDKFQFSKPTHYKIIDKSGKVVLEGDGESVVITSLAYDAPYICDYGGKTSFEFFRKKN